jgi:hypothetical protein
MTLQAVISQIVNNQSTIEINLQFLGLAISAHGNRVVVGSATLSAKSIVNQRISPVSGAGLYRVLVTLKPSDVWLNATASFLGLSFRNFDNSSTFSASAFDFQLSITQGPSGSVGNLKIQLTGVDAKTSLFSGRLSSVQVTGEATLNATSGLSYLDGLLGR